MILGLAVTTVLGACQSYDLDEKQAAVLVEADEQAHLILRQGLGKLLKRADVTLSETAFVNESELIIEPSGQVDGNRLGRDYRRPLHFKLWLSHKQCFLEHVETGDTLLLAGLSCRPE